MKFKPYLLNELVGLFGGYLCNLRSSLSQPSLYSSPSGDFFVNRFATLQNAKAGEISFLTNAKYQSQVLHTHASVVLISPQMYEALRVSGKQLVSNTQLIFWLVDNPYLYYARIQQWWLDISNSKIISLVHSTAVIDESADVDASASIGANVVVGAGAKVGANTQIGAGVVLGAHVAVGSNCLLHANVTVYDACVIGDRVTIHSGAVIGADGFGYAQDKGQWVKIPQVGRVIIADNVEIGANTCIDRGALDDTFIGQGCKLDNLIQIAHNAEVGEYSAIAGCTGVAGSARIGARCAIGGGANILGHLSIAEGTTISPCTTVISSIQTPGVYSGIFPMDTHENWEKNTAVLHKATLLRSRLRKIEQFIKQHFPSLDR